MIEFYSIDSENNEVHYVSLYERHNNTYVFDDKSIENTKVLLTVGNIFRIQRKGNINMDFIFDNDEITEGFYKNNMGLEINFSIKTKQVYFQNNIFDVSYDLYLDGDKISEHHINIKIV